MTPITTAAALADVLARRQPLAEITGALAGAPEQSCCVAPCTLHDVCRDAVAPSSLSWRDGRLEPDPAAAALARLVRCVWRDAGGTRLFDAASASRLPAGLVDRLLLALDRANGYREATPQPRGDERAAFAEAQGVWLTGLLPQMPEAALCVRAYDFASLVASESAADVRLPGGHARIEVLGFPALIAAAVRSGPEPGAERLLDEQGAGGLPFGAARAIVEQADLLSEIGGPDPAFRFLAGSDHPRPLAPAADGPVPVGTDGGPGGRGAVALRGRCQGGR